MVMETIIKLLSDRLEIPEEEITPGTSFKDLGIDSLDTVELIMSLEDELNVSIELDEKVETVGDLAAFVEKQC